MKLRNLYAAITITMLCTPFMAKAGLKELRAAVDQAQIAAKKASENARAYFEDYGIEYDVALELQETAKIALVQAVGTYNDSYMAAFKTSEISQDDKAFLKTMDVDMDELDDESDEESFELAPNRWQQNHSDDMPAITKQLELAQIRPFLQSYENVTATFEWENGQKTELFGDFNRIYDANTGLDMHMAVFAEKTADQLDDNQYGQETDLFGALQVYTDSVIFVEDDTSDHHCLGWNCDCSNRPSEDVMTRWGSGK